MKKIGTIYREASEREMLDTVSKFPTIFVVSYSGLTSNDLNRLRSNLRQAKAKMFIAKNSLARKVFEKTHSPDIAKFIIGPTGFIFLKDDPAVLAKLVKDFSKEKDKLVVLGGLLNRNILEPKDIVILSTLPAKEVLLGMLVTGLKSPITSSVITLKQLLVKMAIVINRVKEKKEEK